MYSCVTGGVTMFGYGARSRLTLCFLLADRFLIRAAFPHKLQMYGSSLHLCGFSHSDLNLNIKFTRKENGARAPQILVYVKNRIEASGELRVHYLSHFG